MTDKLTPRERVLGLLNGEDVDRIACFSGMGNVTTAGFEGLGYHFPELHGDAKKMAQAAATSYQLFGYECAVVPFDLCVEAEALGCVMNPYADVKQLLYPTIKEKIVHSEEEMTTFPIPDRVTEEGRVPVVAEAIRLLKQDLGKEVAIGTYILGPFTLAGQLMDLNDLFKLCFKKQDLVNQMLERLTDVLIAIAQEYIKAGADYICVREMGATTDVLSPRAFKAVIYPHLKKIFDNLSCPHVLHICGGTNKIMDIMKETGAGALSVEQKNDLLASREVIGPETLLFGNIDAYNVLVNGKPEDVEAAVLKSIEGTVDAVWPSCDIWPTAPIENLKTMVETVKKYGASKWARKKAVS
ncbi:MtaA/CmuA family methyltransferase [Calderihabitans maritimus]|uniref:MtaA/CmuA family methyltransferase n=1 Tax=Calderihabitans maritimus TaxID=1246530 RepID=A0A1Z5HNG0_9FIRM|nr:MtaA/CmuA family methyltransferase [Calderihabitans maritimus]GAW91053.1 MtaA/CmuA family methyltransferase [Calderihabitans maritimus]